MKCSAECHSSALESVAEGLWTVSFPDFSAGGIRFGTRSTVVSLEDGLWLHSPGPFSEQQFAQLEALGQVKAVVAPNMMHHLFLQRAADRFPQAKLFLAPGLKEKCPHLPSGQLLDDGTKPWDGVLEHKLVEGMPKLNEVVFYHPESRTLIATDLAFNFRCCDHWPTRLLMSANGVMGRLAPSRLLRYFFTADRQAARDCLLEILEWPFERMVLAHGEVVEHGARAALRHGFSWLLD